MGKKYIIELEEVPFIQHFDNGIGETIYRVKGFNSLVFDWNGLQMLTPYTEPDMEQVRKEGYEDGYENGFVAGHLKAEKSGQSFYEDGYQRGLNDAWEAARWVTKNNAGKNFEAFGTHFTSEIVQKISVSKVIEKIRQYEQRQEEIIDSDKNKVEALANDIGIHKLYALVKEIRGE